MLRSIAVFAVILASFPVGCSIAAELKDEIAKCAVVEGDLDRLTCFDQIAKDAGLNGPQPIPVTVEGTGKWAVKADTNPLDDSKRVVLVLTADSGSSSLGDDVTLFARCQSNETELYINWNDYLASDGDYDDNWKYVTIRVGDEKADKQRWTTSTDEKATFAPDWSGALLKKMLGSTKMVAQVTPYNESPVTAVFDTTGLSNALKPLADACGWTY